MHLTESNKAALFHFEQHEQKEERRSLCTSSILFTEPLLNDCQVMQMKQQIAELSIIALRFGSQKLDYEHTKEQLKAAQQQVCLLAIESRQLRSRNAQLFEQLQASKQTIESLSIRNQAPCSQIAELNQQLQVLQKKFAENIQNWPAKLKTLSKICIKMSKQKLQNQQIIQCQLNQQQKYFEAKESNWKNELFQLQNSKKQIEKILKNRCANSEQNYKELQLKYRIKCKEYETINTELIQSKSKYLQAIEEMNRKMQFSLMRAKDL